MEPKQLNEHPSIADHLTKMNEETSARISSVVTEKRASPNLNGVTLVSSAFVAFARSWFTQRASGTKRSRFIFSCYAALEVILANAKMWEFGFRISEGKGNLPPSNEVEVRRMSAKYSPWTTS